VIAYDLQLDGLSVQVDAADFLTPPANFRISATFVTHNQERQTPNGTHKVDPDRANVAI
jgi:hypothetical protein